MRFIKVKSLPIKDVIIDIANELGVAHSENCNLYSLKIPTSVGTGMIEGIDFGGGFGMLNYNCKFNRALSIEFTYEQVHPVKFLHCYEGRLQHRFENEDLKHLIEQYKSVIVASSTTNGHVLYFDEQQTVSISSIEIDRKNFLNKVSCFSDKEQDDIVRLLRDIDAIETFYHEGNYSLELSRIIQDIQEFKRFPVLESLYYEGKSYEILVHQWAQYHDETVHGGDNSLLRRVDVETFKKMSDFVEQNISKPLTVESLELEFGMSEKKLQDLFKEIKKTTVNSFIQEKRLEKAVCLMNSSKMNISEIVYAIGLSSKSYFSKVFKQEYGMSPSAYARKLKTKKKA